MPESGECHDHPRLVRCIRSTGCSTCHACCVAHSELARKVVLLWHDGHLPRMHALAREGHTMASISLLRGEHCSRRGAALRCGCVASTTLRNSSLRVGAHCVSSSTGNKYTLVTHLRSHSAASNHSKKACDVDGMPLSNSRPGPFLPSTGPTSIACSRASALRKSGSEGP